MNRQTTKTQRAQSTRRMEGAVGGEARGVTRPGTRRDSETRGGAPPGKRHQRAHSSRLLFLSLVVLCVLGVFVVQFVRRARTPAGPVSEEARLREAVQRAPRSWAAH